MFRKFVPVFAGLCVLLGSLHSYAQQTKDPTDTLFEEILGEAIHQQQTTPPLTPTVNQPPVPPPPTQPVVNRNWGNSTYIKPSTTTRVPAVGASAPIGEFTTPSRATSPAAGRNVKSFSGSVMMDLIAPRDINLNRTATIRVQLKNAGEDTLSNVKFIATLPEHAQFETARPQPTSTENGRIEFDGIRLSGRSNSFIEIDVVPTAKAPVNIGTQIQYSNQENIAFHVRQPELDMQVTGPEKLVLGESQPYQIQITNRGDGVANDIRLSAELPEGLQKLRATNTVIDQLAPGKTAQVQVFTQAVQGGEKNVKFHLTSAELDPLSRNATVAIVQPELEVTATGPSVNFLERDGVYRIEITNPGQVICSNVQVGLNVPQQMAVSTISQQAKFNEASRKLVWNFDQINPGQREIIQLKAQCTAEGQHTCSIFVDSDQTVEKEFRINTMVATRADVSINISNNSGPIQTGAPARFEIVVENRGSRSANGVEIDVELPVALSPGVSEEYSIDQYENSIQFRFDDVKPGETKTFTFQAVGAVQGEHVVRSRLRMEGSDRQLIAEDSVYVYDSDQSKVGQRLEPQIRR